MVVDGVDGSCFPVLGFVRNVQLVREIVTDRIRNGVRRDGGHSSRIRTCSSVNKHLEVPSRILAGILGKRPVWTQPLRGAGLVADSEIGGTCSIVERVECKYCSRVATSAIDVHLHATKVPVVSWIVAKVKGGTGRSRDAYGIFGGIVIRPKLQVHGKCASGEAGDIGHHVGIRNDLLDDGSSLPITTLQR